MLFCLNLSKEPSSGKRNSAHCTWLLLISLWMASAKLHEISTKFYIFISISAWHLLITAYKLSSGIPWNIPRVICIPRKYNWQVGYTTRERCITILYHAIGNPVTKTISMRHTHHTQPVLIQCNNCNVQYIGETKRHLSDRFGEHRRAIEKAIAKQQQQHWHYFDITKKVLCSPQLE